MNFLKLFYTAYIFGFIGGGGQGSANQQVIFESADIDALIAGDASLFTVTSKYDFLIPTSVIISTTSVTDFVTAPTLSVGTNDPAYDDIFSGGVVLEPLNATGQSMLIPITSGAWISSDAIGTLIKTNITDEADASVFNIRIILEGIGVNVPEELRESIKQKLFELRGLPPTPKQLTSELLKLKKNKAPTPPLLRNLKGFRK